MSRPVLAAGAALALLSGPAPAAAGDLACEFAAAMLERPETCEEGNLYAPPEARATWFFLGGLRPFDDDGVMVVLSTGELETPMLDPLTADLGPVGPEGDSAGLQMSLRVPEDAGSLRLAYRMIAADPEIGPEVAEDVCSIQVRGIEQRLDPWTGGSLRADSAALRPEPALDAVPWLAGARATPWMEAVVRVQPGVQVQLHFNVRDGADDPAGDTLCLFDAVSFDPAIPGEAIRPGAVPRIDRFERRTVPAEVPTTLRLRGRGLPPELSARILRDGAPEVELEAERDVRLRSAEQVELDLPGLSSGLRGLQLVWDGGSFELGDALDVRPGRPVVDRISPATGPAAGGNLASLEGSGFHDVGDVFFGDAAAKVLVESPSRITAVVPPRARAGGDAVDVLVTAGGQNHVVAEGYTYAAPPSPPEPAATPDPGGPVVDGCRVGAGAPARTALLLLALLPWRRRR